MTPPDFGSERKVFRAYGAYDSYRATCAYLGATPLPPAYSNPNAAIVDWRHHWHVLQRIEGELEAMNKCDSFGCERDAVAFTFEDVDGTGRRKKLYWCKRCASPQAFDIVHHRRDSGASGWQEAPEGTTEEPSAD